MPLTTETDMCIPGMQQMMGQMSGRPNLLIANQGPSTPVKYDEKMGVFAPNQGAGRPGQVRLKNPPKGMA